MGTTAPRVVLGSMPWTSLCEPSLGLGILKARLAERGVRCRVRHLNLLLLRHLSSATYLDVANVPALNDFVFTQPMEPEPTAGQLALLRERVEASLAGTGGASWSRYRDPDRLVDLVLRVRQEVVPQYLSECADLICADEPTLLGLTCLFDQTIASVALAKVVKERLPETLVVLGGYSVEGATGDTVLRAFPWLDAVASGEGEDVISPLAAASLDRSLLAEIPGLRYRATPGGAPVAPARPAVRPAIDESPTPDYDDFLADLADLAERDRIDVRFDTLPVETSRGCWWGQVSHCVFCGIDDDTMKYRAKSADRVLAMLAELSERYGLRQFRICDYILPNDYFRTLLPRLATLPEPYTFSCEIKANMTYEKFRLLRDAGFTEVQPGVESFSTPVLKAMAKGVRAIQNVHTLLLGRRFGIEVHYNVLYGFPGDDPADYEAMLAVVPMLYHLNPPVSRVRVLTTRYAPLQADPGRFGIATAPQHDHAYELVLSPEHAERIGFSYDDFCYYFETPYVPSEELRTMYALLTRQVDHWKALHRARRPVLSYERLPGGGVAFTDSRFTPEPVVTTFGPDHATVYERCAISPCHVAEATDGVGPEALDDLVRARVVFREGDRVLGLALPPECWAEEPRTGSRKWAAPYV